MILLLNVMRNNKLTARIFLTQKRINLVVFFSSSSSPERDEAAVVSFSKSRSHEIVFFFYNVIHCNRPQNVWCGCCCFLFFFFSAHKQQQQQTEKVERILFNSRFVIYNYQTFLLLSIWCYRSVCLTRSQLGDVISSRK